MEETDLTSADYWNGDSVDIRINPAANLNLRGLQDVVEERGITASIVLATSGSSGAHKLIVLSKQAMLASAESVNRWCQITRDDTWLGGLSTFHVGGLGIYCRAFLTGSNVYHMEWNRWSRDGATFLEALKDATITSLTPVHLHDLVKAKARSPKTIRGVFIGGGKLSQALADQASELGWPLWPTFGMTEAGSQIATSIEGEVNQLPVLPHWETKTSTEGILQIKGPALMDGYFSRGKNDSTWKWNEAGDSEGFYSCGDRVSLRSGKLQPLGRSDDLVKILGELVSVAKLEQSLGEALGTRAAVIAMPAARSGSSLAAFVETDIDLSKEFTDWNESLPPYEKIDRLRSMESFPRTEVGKIDRQALMGMIDN